MSRNGSLKHSVSAISVVVEAEADATGAAAVDALRFRHISLEVIIRRSVAEVEAAAACFFMAQDEGAAVCGAAPFVELRAAAAAASRLLWLFINRETSVSVDREFIIILRSVVSGNGSAMDSMKFFFFNLRLLWWSLIVEAAVACELIPGAIEVAAAT